MTWVTIHLQTHEFIQKFLPLSDSKNSTKVRINRRIVRNFFEWAASLVTSHSILVPIRIWNYLEL